MHLPKIYIILGIFIVSVALIFILLFFLGFSLSTQNKTHSTVSPTVIIPTVYRVPSISTQPSSLTPSDKKMYSDPANRFSFRYPFEWTIAEKLSPSDETVTFTFSENNKLYAFHIAPPGTSGLQAFETQADTVNDQPISYAGRQFLQRTWLYNNQAIFISVLPNEKDFYFPIFEIRLPPTNTQKYINAFSALLASLRLSSDFSPPLTPAPTLFGPQTYHVPQKQ